MMCLMLTGAEHTHCVQSFLSSEYLCWLVCYNAVLPFVSDFVGAKLILFHKSTKFIYPSSLKVLYIVLYSANFKNFDDIAVESMIYCTFIWWFQKFSLFLRKSLLCQTMELMDIMKQRRETLSLTQQDLAEMSQVGLATIKDIERGKGNPALSTVKKILDVLGIEIEYRIRQTV